MLCIDGAAEWASVVWDPVTGKATYYLTDGAVPYLSDGAVHQDRPHKEVALLCLDLDGTVRQGKDDALGRFVNGPDDVVVFPEAVAYIRRWKANGGRVIGVSNQGGIALGLVDGQDVARAMRETARQCEWLFDKICWCPHHPTATDPDMRRCWCRKPKPGLIIEAAVVLAAEHREHYPARRGLMVGDRPEDEQCAGWAGLDFMSAADWRKQAQGRETP
jgi:D-glycero-D-manno-heptose 1,7-bisphosphate phosphatase